jgi:Polyketide cyclase / dehydrase and lipid transport
MWTSGFAREENIQIQAPASRIFDYVADVRRHPEWAAQRLVVRSQDGNGVSVGTYESTAYLGLPIRGRIRIVSAEPPLRFAYECEDMSGHYLWTMSLRSLGGGVRLTMRVERLAGPWWVRLLQPVFIWPLVGRRGVRRALANIRRQIETSIPLD